MGARLWRNFQAEGQRPTPEEFELAISLVEKFSSSDVEPEAYTDLYPTKVLAMLEEKSRGHHHCPTASGQVVDLNEALKRSLKQSEPREDERETANAL
jgi:non-homologous end joining protein Ku